ncbi:MAG: class I SAM-dependent methyltransferase [Promethearchaeota archaeon]|jgi:SAM-dependent methyltransferase
MKKIGDIEYFSIIEIAENFLSKKTEEDIVKLFEVGKINGKKFENEWYADKEAINNFKNVYQNEKYFTVGPFDIDLTKFMMEGRILDIGGGGEAIISQFKGEQVVAIDPNKKELESSPDNNALSIIMDAKDLQFLDNTFDTTSSFFTMMYIPLNDHKKIFQEIHRVLKSNGEFFLWDVSIPKKRDKKEEIYVVMLKVKINGTVIDTGYGTKWEKEQNAEHFIKHGKEVGFEVLEQKLEPNLFLLKFRKA